MRGMLAATGLHRRSAIHRADLFSLPRLHDNSGAADVNGLQCGAKLSFHRLERGECGFEYASSFHLPEQRWLHSYSQRWRLFLGDAHHHRLWNRLSFEFLRNGIVASERRDDWSGIQRLQRQHGFLGIEPHHGPAMRPDLAADFCGSQWSLQLGKAAAVFAARHMERLRRGNRDRVWNRQLLRPLSLADGKLFAMDDQRERKYRRSLFRIHQPGRAEPDVPDRSRGWRSLSEPLPISGPCRQLSAFCPGRR